MAAYASSSSALKQMSSAVRLLPRCQRVACREFAGIRRSIHSQSANKSVSSSTSSLLHTSRTRSLPDSTPRRHAVRSLNLRFYSEQARPVGCPTCSAPLPVSPKEQMLSHCPACNAFLPPSETIDYFELFSLPREFALDKSMLKRKFLQWQGLVHPDKLPQAVNNQARRQQEDWANMWSSIVNEGYKTLGDDRLRGEYILEHKGVAIAEEDKMDDPELLMEIMEVREALEDAHTQEEVDAIRESNAEKTKDTLAELENLLNSESIDPVDAKDLLIRLRYMNNVEGVCREWQPGKAIVLQH